ncbi:MAG: DUF4296 domain-containing protein [Bacteroidaceae bacterium]|nr:DUF4296 domain-containing protein [Bacteroidaceae bacterium]
MKACPIPFRGSHALALLCSFILLACSPSRPRGILSKQKMTDVLVDYHLAQGMAETQTDNGEAARYKFIQAVFKKHRISEAAFDSSMVYYSGRAEEFTHIYDNVLTRVQAQAERMGLELAQNQDKFATLTSEGDTANIWLGQDFACVIATPTQCIYSFTMKADSTFRAGDSFIWRFKTQFVGRSMNNEAIALLNFYYDNDTVAAVNDLLRNSPKNELSHYPNRALDSLTVRSITGFIYLPMVQDADQPKPLLVSQMQLIRMHKAKPVEVVPQTQAISDSTDVDTVQQKKGERLSPLQVRESQPKERKIHITKENPNPIHPERGIPQRIRRK